MKQKEILTILIPVFILTILWVLFNIYHNHVTSTIKDPLSVQIIPINGNFDRKTINDLSKRKKVDPAYEVISQEENISPSPTPTLTPEEEVPISKIPENTSPTP